MKPILVMLALFLLVFIGQDFDKSGNNAADMNQTFVKAACIEYEPFGECRNNFDDADQKPAHTSTLIIQNGVTDTIQADLSGKHFPLSLIVF